jgi:ParB family chromosome partitioning protein
VRPLPRHEAEEWKILINFEETHPSYVVIAGNRRLLGARRAGLQEVPCVIRVTDADKAFVMNVVENVQRRDLSGAERVRSIMLLASLRGADERPLPTTEVARLTGLNQSTVWRWLRIHDKPALREALASDRLDIGRAMKLVSVPDEHLGDVLEEAPALSQLELENRVAQYREDPAVIAKRAASLTERRLMDALRTLGKVDQVPREGAARDLLALVRQRVEELWDIPIDVLDRSGNEATPGLAARPSRPAAMPKA